MQVEKFFNGFISSTGFIFHQAEIMSSILLSLLTYCHGLHINKPSWLLGPFATMLNASQSAKTVLIFSFN